MSKVKAAKAFIFLLHALLWLVLIAVGCTVLWLLWTWAVVHPVSFFPLVGVATAIALVSGGISLYNWAEGVIEKDKEEELVAQYENKYGVKPQKDPYTGALLLNSPPVPTRNRPVSYEDGLRFHMGNVIVDEDEEESYE